jgi:hypothetical protein
MYPDVPVPRYYVDMNYDSQVAVRATATGAVTATVPVPHVHLAGDGMVASGPGGVFYVADMVSQAQERIYRFVVTSSGQVSGFAPVKGVTLDNAYAEEMAVSPDGSQLAVAVSHGAMTPATLTVISVKTGAQRVWQGGMAQAGYRTFDINGLSWESARHNVVFSTQRCQIDEVNNQKCGSAVHGDHRLSQVWSLDVAGPGGQFSDGHLLLQQSPRYPYIATAVISPDGSTITAVVMSGPIHSPGSNTVPSKLNVIQIGAASGQQQRVLYQRPTGPTFGWILGPDGSGTRWLLDGAPEYTGDGPPSQQSKGYNGWITRGQLTGVQPADGELAGESW